MRLDKPRNGETWKSRTVDITARFGIAQKYIGGLQSALFDCLTGKAKLICRTDGTYPSDMGCYWYQMRSGLVVCCDYESGEVSTFESLAEARQFYSTLRADWNVAAYQVLMQAHEVSA